MKEIQITLEDLFTAHEENCQIFQFSSRGRRRDRLIVMSRGSRVVQGGKQTNKPSMSLYKSPLVA